ncbi:MAG: HNH endonuclease, partial [Planctomycetales bacterium 4572_13]
LMVYFCSGTDSERLEWFRTINIAGEKLTEQELRNAVYAGSWVTDVKRYFSKTGCAAYGLGSDYLNGSPIRQDYLETAIKWISEGHIEDYMAQHQHDQNANALWRYFQDVITWVEGTFTKKRKKFMKGVDWGSLYNACKDKQYDTKKIEKETAKLILDDDVTKKSGIYPYILTRDEKHLSIRGFSDAMKQKCYEKQKGKCPVCKKKFDIEDTEADHITPWHAGGKTTEENCQMLCKECNRRKSGK